MTFDRKTEKPGPGFPLVSLASGPVRRQGRQESAEPDSTPTGSATPGPPFTLSNSRSVSSAVQRAQAAPALSAASLLAADKAALHRAAAEVEGSQAQVDASRLALTGRHLVPTPATALPRHAPAPVPSPPTLNPVQRQEVTDSARHTVTADFTRDARYVPGAVRAEMALASIQRAVKQGADGEALHAHLETLARTPQDQAAVQRAVGLQRQQDDRMARVREDHALQVEHARLQRQLDEARGRQAEANLGSVTERVRARQGVGQPLPAAVQRHLEAGLNADLSRVRVHTDAEADTLAQGVGAKAFTSGADIYFRQGQYDPHSAEGLELLAHEATHVVQQAQGKVSAGLDPDAGLEAEAQQMGAKLGGTPLGSAGAVPSSQATQSAGPVNAVAVQRKQAPPGVAQEGAAALHDAVEKNTRGMGTTGSPATLLFGVEVAADMRLGSTRRIAKDKGFWSGGLQYPSLDEAEGPLRTVLQRLRAAGTLTAALSAYQARYGQDFDAVLGERVRDVNTRQRLLALMPPPISEAQLTRDAFLEQLAVQYVYLNASAAGMQNMTNDGRRGSSPKDILSTFGFQAGPPVSGKWGLQMRVFLPIAGKAKVPYPVVAFRGTEGISFSMKDSPEGTTDTVIGDFSPEGVGYNQYTLNHELIRRNVVAAAGHGKLIFTGHSLGGAIAQIAAAEFQGLAAEVVTFQSPAIKARDVAGVQAKNKANPRSAMLARHYRIDGDAVPTAGEADLPGTIYYFDRVQRPKGSKAPYGVELSGDSLDMTRATAGHVTPMLSTYLRGTNPKDGPLRTLAEKGLRDEGTLDEKPQDVAMVYGGSYSTTKDPRINLEPKRTTTGVWAMQKAGQYDAVFYDQIAYNTLLDRVEGLAGSGQYQEYQAFRAAALSLIGSVSGKGRLPMTKQDRLLGLQFPLPKKQATAAAPRGGVVWQDSPFTRMQREGVAIDEPSVIRVTRELRGIWNSWHPEVKP